MNLGHLMEGTSRWKVCWNWFLNQKSMIYRYLYINESNEWQKNCIVILMGFKEFSGNVPVMNISHDLKCCVEREKVRI